MSSAILWELPGPRRFIDRVRSAVMAGTMLNVVVPAPNWPCDLRETLRAATRDSARSWSDLDGLSLLSGEGLLLDVFCELLELEREMPGKRRDPVTVARNPEIAGRILAVDLRRVSSETDSEPYHVFLRSFAAAARDLEPVHRPVILTLSTPAQLGLGPKGDLDVVRRTLWWWGVIDRVDSLVTAHLHPRAADIDPSDLAAVAEVAAFDLDLIDHLLGETQFSSDALVEQVRTYGKLQQCTGRDVPIVLTSPEHPHDLLIPAWSAGMVERWGSDFACHHAANSRMVSDVDLSRRVWAAQAASLLPFIELTRQRLADWVEQRRVGLPARYDGIDFQLMEVGALKDVVLYTSLRAHPGHKRLAKWLASTRNELAHLRLVSASTMTEGRQLAAVFADVP